MLVGNDFLPHCPHLSIDGGALSLMLSAYTDLLPKMGGYMTKREKVSAARSAELRRRAKQDELHSFRLSKASASLLSTSHMHLLLFSCSNFADTPAEVSDVHR